MPDAYAIPENGVLDVAAGAGVLVNDVDPDGDPLTAALVAAPSDGSLTLAADGSFTYTPDPDFAGSDAFTYEATDGALFSGPITVDLTIHAVNDAPVGIDDAGAVDEDDALAVAAPGVLANDLDVDGDLLSAVLENGPANGNLTLDPDGGYTYVPDADFFGTDSFTYRASDGTADSDVVTVDITVNAVDDAPVAAADDYTLDEDVTLVVPAPGVLANDDDVDGDPFVAQLVSGPADGLLTLATDGSFSYVPDADFAGADSFTYRAAGALLFAPATVSLVITPVNDPPVAADDVGMLDEDGSLDVAAPGVLANDDDVDGDALVAVLVSGPAFGVLTLDTTGAFLYVPDPEFSGSDSFRYRANDGAANSLVVTMFLTVNAVNDAPAPVADAHSVAEDDSLSVPAPGVLGNDVDIEGDPLGATLVSGPSNGSLSLATDGSFVYTPDADYAGPDSFTYEAFDGLLAAAAVVSLTVTPVPDPPIAMDDAHTVAEDGMLNVAAPGVLGNDTDADGDSLSASLVSGPANGLLTLGSDGSFAYTPAADFHGSDSFVYAAADGSTSAAATVTITVTPVNDAPVALDDDHDAVRDTPLVIAAPGVLGNDTDADGDPLDASVVSGPTNGSLSLSPDGSFTWTPDSGFIGTDSFVYAAGDPGLLSGEATVTITIPNTPPVADAGTDQVVPVSSLVVLDGSGSFDADLQTLTYAWTQTAGSPVALSDPTAVSPTFTAPAADDTLVFTLVVDDGIVPSDPDTVTITLDSNVPPTAVATSTGDAFSFEPVALDGSASTDELGAPLTYSWTQTGGPTAVLSSTSAAQPTFTAPDVAVDSTLTFELVVHDGSAASAPAPVSMEVLRYTGNRATTTLSPMQRLGGAGTILVDLDVLDGYGFAAASGTGGFRVFDLSNPVAPVQVGSIDGVFASGVQPIWVRAAASDVVYLSNLNNFWIIDVSNKAAPVQIGEWNSGNTNIYVGRFEVSGTWAFTAASINGLRVLDLSNPAVPASVTVLPFPTLPAPAQYPTDVALSGTTLYVATGDGDRIRFVDVSTPASPVLLAGGITINGVFNVEIDPARNRLFATSESGFNVYDITTPLSPVLVGSWSFGYPGTIRGPRDLRLSGTTAYLTDDFNRVHVLDVSTDTPVVSGSYTGVNGAATGHGASGVVYLTGGVGGGITVVDAALPVPFESSATPLSLAFESVRDGDYAYVGWDDGVRTFDVSDPAAPIVTGSRALGGSWNNGLVRSGNYLYGINGLLGIFDLAALPTNPPVVGSLTFGAVSTTDVAVCGARAYVGANAAASSLRAVDVSTPSAPSQVGSHALSAFPGAVVCHEDLAYVAAGTALRVVDFSVPASPVETGSVAMSTAQDLAIDYPYGWAATSGGFSSLALGNPSAPAVQSTIALPTSVTGRGVELAGNLAYVAAGRDISGYVNVYDVTVRSKAAWVGTIDTIGADQVSADPGGALYVSQDNTFVGRFRITHAGATVITAGEAARLAPSTVRVYDLAYADLYPGTDEQIACTVSGGSCAVVSIDQVANTAQVSWTLPAAPGDHEVSIAIGNHHYFNAATDRVRVE